MLPKRSFCRFIDERISGSKDNRLRPVSRGLGCPGYQSVNLGRNSGVQIKHVSICSRWDIGKQTESADERHSLLLQDHRVGLLRMNDIARAESEEALLNDELS